MRILVARGPLDFRRGIDGTIAACRQVLLEDPFSGAVFVFRARSGKMVRILVYDGQGFWLMTKCYRTGLMSGSWTGWLMVIAGLISWDPALEGWSGRST